MTAGVSYLLGCCQQLHVPVLGSTLQHRLTAGSMHVHWLDILAAHRYTPRVLHVPTACRRSSSSTQSASSAKPSQAAASAQKQQAPAEASKAGAAPQQDAAKSAQSPADAKGSQAAAVYSQGEADSSQQAAAWQDTYSLHVRMSHFCSICCFTLLQPTLSVTRTRFQHIGVHVVMCWYACPPVTTNHGTGGGVMSGYLDNKSLCSTPMHPLNWPKQTW